MHSIISVQPFLFARRCGSQIQGTTLRLSTPTHDANRLATGRPSDTPYFDSVEHRNSRCAVPGKLPDEVDSTNHSPGVFRASRSRHWEVDFCTFLEHVDTPP